MSVSNRYKKCNKCGSSVNFDLNNCQNCGNDSFSREVENTCEKCHMSIEEGLTFCPKCGELEKQKIQNKEINLSLFKYLICYLSFASFMFVLFRIGNSLNSVSFDFPKQLFQICVGSFLINIIFFVKVFYYSIKNNEHNLFIFYVTFFVIHVIFFFLT